MGAGPGSTDPDSTDPADRPDTDEPVDPAPTITATSDRVTILRDQPIDVDIDCNGEITVSVDDGEPTVLGTEPLRLDVGDHQVEVRCDGRPVTSTEVSVIEPIDRRGPTPAAASVLLLLVCATSLLASVAPGSRRANRGA